MLEEEGIRACFGKSGASHSQISHCLMFIRVAHPELISLAVIVEDTTREKVVARRVRYICMDGALRSGRKHDCLLIVVVSIQRQQERRLLVMAQGTGERSFIVG